MARFIAQIILAGTQVVARAFARAVRQEMAASQEAARRLGNTRSRAEQMGNVKLGLTLDEAKQILNVSNINKAEVEEKYHKLFNANERDRGGTFYIQSKIVRARERLDHELSTGEVKGAPPESASKT